MGQQRRIKQFRRELRQFRRKNQRAEEVYFPAEYEVFPVVTEEQIHDEENIKLNEDEEIDEILNRSMKIFPYFSCINYEL